MNRKKVIKTKSFIESKMLESGGIRTHVLRMTVVIKQNLVPILYNKAFILIEILLN